MTDGELIDWLSTHPVTTEWLGELGWRVRGFAIIGQGADFRSALIQTIEHERRGRATVAGSDRRAKPETEVVF